MARTRSTKSPAKSAEDGKRGPWSVTEDKLLLSFVPTENEQNWVHVSNQIPGRSAKQCRERYHQNLKPGLIHTPITPYEGRMIERYVETHGKKWADCARMLTGRSDNAVKNWYNGAQNRKTRAAKRFAAAHPQEMHSGMAQQQPLPPAPAYALPHGSYPEPAGYGHASSGYRPPITSDAPHYHGSLTNLQWRRCPTPSAEAAPSLVSDNGSSSYTTSPSTRGYNSLPTSPTYPGSRSNSFSSLYPERLSDARGDELEQNGKLHSIKPIIDEAESQRLPAMAKWEASLAYRPQVAAHESVELPPIRTPLPNQAPRSPEFSPESPALSPVDSHASGEERKTRGPRLTDLLNPQ